MSATTITYNGVTLQNVEIQSIESAVEYDASGITPIFRRVRIQANGTVRGATPNEAGLVSSAEALQAALSVPRERLVVSFGGSTLFDAPSQTLPDTADFDRGPRPQDVTVRRVVGGRFAFVALSVEFVVPVQGLPAAVAEGSSAYILSNRWSQTFSVDEVNMGTRTVEGIIRLSGHLSAPDPDAFRGFVWPIEAAGFRRVSAEFGVSADGLSLIYRVVDREQARPLPSGVIKAEGTYSLNIRGAKATRSIQFRLEGEKYQPSADIIKAAHDVLSTRFDLDGVMIDFQATEDMFGRNGITIQATQIDPRGSSIGYVDKSFFSNPSSSTGYVDSGRFRQITPYGSSLVKATYQAMFEPEDGAPADPTAIARASVESAASVPGATRVDLDSDSFAEGYSPDGSAGDTVLAATIMPTLSGSDPTEAILTSRTSVVDSAQNEQTYYVDSVVEQSYRTETRSVAVPAADPLAPDAIYQSKPAVFYVIRGKTTRNRSAPVIPTPSELANTGRDWFLVSENKQSGTPTYSADAGQVAFTAAWEYVLRARVMPDQAEWAARTITFADGASGDFLEFQPSRSGVPTGKPPEVASAAISPIPAAVPVGSSLV